MQNLYEQLFYRTPLVATSEKYEYTVYMLDLLKDCYKCFFLSLIEKHRNEPIIYYNFSFVIEKSFWNLISLLHSLTYHFLLLFSSTFSVVLNYYFFRWLACKSLLSRFLVLINYFMWSYNLFSVSNIFQGPGFSGSRFFRGRVQGLESRFRSSPTLVHIFSYIEEEKMWK